MRNVGSAGENRSAVAVPGEASQRESAGGPDRDPSASRSSAGTDSVNQYGAWADQVLWGAAARLQCQKSESRESRGTESIACPAVGQGHPGIACWQTQGRTADHHIVLPVEVTSTNSGVSSPFSDSNRGERTAPFVPISC